MLNNMCGKYGSFFCSFDSFLVKSYFYSKYDGAIGQSIITPSLRNQNIFLSTIKSKLLVFKDGASEY